MAPSFRKNNWPRSVNSDLNRLSRSHYTVHGYWYDMSGNISIRFNFQRQPDHVQVIRMCNGIFYIVFIDDNTEVINLQFNENVYRIDF